jgi:hypothetical protein
MEIWVTLWCRRDVRRSRLDLCFDVAVSAGREVRTLSGGSRRSPLGADKGVASRPNAPATIGCFDRSGSQGHTVASNGSTIRKNVNAVPRLP